MTDEDARHSVSVAGVVIDEDGCTLVVQRRDNGHGEPPGGILERDESIADGLVREVREETGLIVEPIALTGVYKNTSQGIVTLVFRCRVKSNPGGVISQEAFSAYEVLADLARSVGLDATFEVVPPPGLVHLNRPNLVVLTNPRLLPFLSQILEADPHLRYLHDDDGWYLFDRTTDTEHRSPMNHGDAVDYAYIGRLPRPDGNGPFLYAAGTHAPGTLGAAHFIADNIIDLYREVKNRRFSLLISCRYDPKEHKKILAADRLTPIYQHDGA